MSSTYTQLPGTMNHAFKRGNDFAALIGFDGTTLVGYTVTASVTSLVTGATVVPFTTTVADASAGQVQVALSDTQTAALPAEPSAETSTPLRAGNKQCWPTLRLARLVPEMKGKPRVPAIFFAASAGRLMLSLNLISCTFFATSAS